MTSWVQGYVYGSAEMMTTLVGGFPEQDLSRPEAVTALAERQARFGTASGFVFDPPDADALQGWLDTYCRDHPLEQIIQASLALVAELAEGPR